MIIKWHSNKSKDSGEFEISTVGEGIVWKCVTKHAIYDTSKLIFKTKGEKHSESKVKIIVEVDVEKVNNVNEFVDAVVTEHRLEKKFVESGLSTDAKNTGDFIRIIMNDVLKEEADRMEVSGLSAKDVTSNIAKKTRIWFLNKT
jgi:hypothetical protein